MDDNFIYKVNVSGTIYHITRKTLLKIPYFADYYKDYDGDHTKEIFVERSPAKYYYELDKYGVIYDKDTLYDDNKDKYICKADDCDNYYYKKGDLYCKEHIGNYCTTCYNNIPEKNTRCLECKLTEKYICKIDDCDNFYTEKGNLYCSEHSGNYCRGGW